MKKCSFILLLLVSCSKGPSTAESPPLGSSAQAPPALGAPPEPVHPEKTAYAPESVAATAGVFTTTDGRRGWKVAIPGGRPLATPAYAQGRLYVGGGYGSHEFYCLDAESGKVLWEYKTGDDGPTAAVVDQGQVVFNTESCTIYTLDVGTGKLSWSKWLGDPLMSQPAVDQGKVYMAYPGKDGSHHLACMALRDGNPLWDQKIAGDVIAAPIVQGPSVYLTTFDGTVYRYEAADGKLAWSEKRDATSPPWIWGNQVLVSQGKDIDDAMRARPGHSYGRAAKGEMLAMRQARAVAKPEAPVILEGSQKAADYLDAKKQGGTGGLALQKAIPEDPEIIKKGQAGADSGVGFTVAPESAKLAEAERNVGIKTVCGAWAYQGSRPSIAGDQCFAAMGDLLLCHDLKSGRILWEKSLKPPKTVEGMRLLAPPALANQKIFLSTALGDILCLDANGKLLWSVNVGEPIVFQPTVMKGKVFVGTSGGHVLAIETGDSRDDGWAMWGGSASHNGPGGGR